MKISLSLFLFSSIVTVCSAQTITFGVKGGAILTNPSTSGRNDESRRYIVGPSFEVKLPGNFAVEVDALYSRIGNSFTFSRPLGTNLIVNSGSATLDGGIVTTAIRNRGNSWEFPVLGKYYFGRRTSDWRPFVSTGYSFRKIWITSNATYAYSNIDQYPNVTPITASKNSSVSDTGVGAVFGGGLSYRAGRVSIAPEFRYIRWGVQSFPTRRNQAQIMLGIRF